MKTFKIHAIREKARRTGYGQEYIDDCEALAESWDEQADAARFTAEAVTELRATWPSNIKRPEPQQPIPGGGCPGCRRL